MDVERTMEFILQMQAKHAEALRQHDEALRQHDEALHQHQVWKQDQDARMEALTDLVGRLAQAQLNHLAETRAAQAAADARAQALDERLSALIAIVDDLIRHRNGGGRH